MGTNVRRGVAAVLVAAMGVFGVGCTGQPLSQQQQQSIGNFVFLVIYMGLCQANHGVCPFPIAPTLPPGTPATPPPPIPGPALQLATG